MEKAMAPRVSATQMNGWCDHKVQPVVKAVMDGSDKELREVLEKAVVEGALMSNFLPLPFAQHSSHGIRLLAAWAEVKEKYPSRAMTEEFVWRFWSPRAHDLDAYLVDMIGGVSFPALSARTLAFQAAGVRC